LKAYGGKQTDRKTLVAAEEGVAAVPIHPQAVVTLPPVTASLSLTLQLPLTGLDLVRD